MKLQDLLLPIRDLIVWSFETILESDGLTNLINAGIVVLIVLGLGAWLRIQKGYTKKAMDEGTIV